MAVMVPLYCIIKYRDFSLQYLFYNYYGEHSVIVTETIDQKQQTNVKRIIKTNVIIRIEKTITNTFIVSFSISYILLIMLHVVVSALQAQIIV